MTMVKGVLVSALVADAVKVQLKAWQKAVDETGQAYFYDAETNKSAWSLPEEFVNTDKWNVVWNAEYNRHCYYNKETNQGVWEIPDEDLKLTRESGGQFVEALPTAEEDFDLDEENDFRESQREHVASETEVFIITWNQKIKKENETKRWVNLVASVSLKTMGPPNSVLPSPKVKLRPLIPPPLPAYRGTIPMQEGTHLAVPMRPQEESMFTFTRDSFFQGANPLLQKASNDEKNVSSSANSSSLFEELDGAELFYYPYQKGKQDKQGGYAFRVRKRKKKAGRPMSIRGMIGAKENWDDENYIDRKIKFIQSERTEGFNTTPAEEQYRPYIRTRIENILVSDKVVIEEITELKKFLENIDGYKIEISANTHKSSLRAKKHIWRDIEKT